MDLEIAEEEKHLIESCNKQLEEFEINYHKNHDKLVEEVFQKVIGE